MLKIDFVWLYGPLWQDYGPNKNKWLSILLTFSLKMNNSPLRNETASKCPSQASGVSLEEGVVVVSGPLGGVTVRGLIVGSGVCGPTVPGMPCFVSWVLCMSTVSSSPTYVTSRSVVVLTVLSVVGLLVVVVVRLRLDSSSDSCSSEDSLPCPAGLDTAIIQVLLSLALTLIDYFSGVNIKFWSQRPQIFSFFQITPK